MTTHGDLRTDLQQIPVPAVPIGEILHRGRALKRRKSMALAVATVTSIAVIGLGIEEWRTFSVQDVQGPGPASAATPKDTAELQVFVLHDITSSEKRNIRSVARTLDAVVSVSFVSKREAYRDFKELYLDEPEYWENLPMDALPAYFVIDLEDGSDIQAARDLLNGLPGVDEVMWSPSR